MGGMGGMWVCWGERGGTMLMVVGLGLACVAGQEGERERRRVAPTAVPSRVGGWARAGMATHGPAGTLPPSRAHRRPVHAVQALRSILTSSHGGTSPAFQPAQRGGAP